MSLEAWQRIHGEYLGERTFLIPELTHKFETAIAMHSEKLLPCGVKGLTLVDIASGVRPTYSSLISKLKKNHPELNIKVQLVDIAFYNPHKPLNVDISKLKSLILLLSTAVTSLHGCNPELIYKYTEAHDAFVYRNYQKAFTLLYELLEYLRITVNFCGMDVRDWQPINAEMITVSSLINYLHSKESTILFDKIISSTNSIGFLNDENMIGEVGHLIHPSRCPNSAVIDLITSNNFDIVHPIGYPGQEAILFNRKIEP